MGRAHQYASFAKGAGFSDAVDHDSFTTNRLKVASEIETIASSKAELQNLLTDETVVFRDLKKQHALIHLELESLRKRRSNIPASMLAIWDELCRELRLDDSGLPFAGEPAPFDYVRATSVAEACALLASDEDARVISGGQTLIPMLAMRLARPARLIDIYRLPELNGIRVDGEVLAIGATTRQVQVERSATAREACPLLAKALPWVGHPPPSWNVST